MVGLVEGCFHSKKRKKRFSRGLPVKYKIDAQNLKQILRRWRI